MAPSIGRKGSLLIAFVVLTLFTCIVSARSKAADQLTVPEIEDELQKCHVVKSLNAAKALEHIGTSSYASKLFAILFPSNPAINALLATAYISGPPNFLLALCPPNIDPTSLSVMVAFAVGGILGDTFLHLIPEIFLGEESPEHVKFVMIEPRKNLILGVTILLGFMAFVLMDKALRIATGGEGHEHDHSHSHSHGKSHSNEVAKKIASALVASGVDVNDTIKSRKKGKKPSSEGVVKQSLQDSSREQASTSIKLGAYLNLIADFTHNITDGLAMSASFYASPTLGATTTAAVFFHEIPHEVGDFALLIQSGFSKRAAMGAQFVTAIGAFLGTIIGIMIQEYGGSSSTHGGPVMGIAGTSLLWGDLLLPFVAGTFLYVGTVSVIPELLQIDSTASKASEWKKTLTQCVALAAGAGIMLYISW